MRPIKQKLEEHNIKFSESYLKGSSFLLSDGTYCNLIEQDELGTNKFLAHHMLDRYIVDKNIITQEQRDEIRRENEKRKRPYFIISLQERILRYTDNAITLNDGSNFGWENCYVDLPNEMPKDKQLEKLILWLDDRHYKNPKNKRRLDVSLEDNVITFNLDNDSTDDIIKEIKKLYNISERT